MNPMNFLAHLHLSGDDPEILTGNLMGDFVKGRLHGRFPPRLTIGLQLHRRIDSFAAGHPAFQASRFRLDPRFGLYRSVLVDLFYDHLLAVHWNLYSREPLDSFISRCESMVMSHGSLLPEPLRRILPLIFGEWLPSYVDPEGIERVLVRMSTRVGRGNPLAEGGGELLRCHDFLTEDFQRFYPALMTFADDFLGG